MNRKAFLMNSLKVLQVFLVISSFWCLAQFGFYIMDHVLDRIDYLSKPSNDYRYYEQSVGYKNKHLIIHGLCRGYTYILPIHKHVDESSMLSMKYHGGGIRNLRMIDTDDIEKQILEAAQSMVCFYKRPIIIAHSYSAAMCIDMSVRGVLPKEIVLVLIAPAIAVKDNIKIRILTTLFDFYYVLVPTRHLISNIMRLMWQTNMLTKDDDESQALCRKFLEENQMFSRRGLEKVSELAILAQNRLRKASPNGLQNEYVLVLSGNDEEVDNSIIIDLISKNAKKMITLPNSPHSAFQSKNPSVREKFFAAVDDMLKVVD